MYIYIYKHISLFIYTYTYTCTYIYAYIDVGLKCPKNPSKLEGLLIVDTSSPIRLHTYIYKYI